MNSQNEEDMKGMDGVEITDNKTSTRLEVEHMEITFIQNGVEFNDAETGTVQVGQDLKAEECFANFVTCLENLEICSNSEMESNLSQQRMKEIKIQISDTFAQLMTHLQDDFTQTLTDSKNCSTALFGKSMSNCLQIICNGILHYLHKNEIYGNRAKEHHDFFKDLIVRCGKLSATCFEVIRRHLNQLHELEEEEITELIEISVEALILTTSCPQILPSVAKLFVSIFKAFQLKELGNSVHSVSLGTKMIQHLKKLEDSKLEDKLSASAEKTINYYGKIVLKYLTDSKMKISAWNNCLVNALDICKLIEETSICKGQDLQVLGFYSELIYAFSEIPDFIFTIIDSTCLWETKLRILVKLKIINVCSSVPGISTVLISIFHDVMNFTEGTEDRVVEVLQFIDSRIIHLVCNFVKCLNQARFQEFQRKVITFLIKEWPTKYCFITMELIADIFAFITKNATDEIVEEYLNVFSTPSLPPQIRYFIFPVILKHSTFGSKEEEFELADVNLIVKYNRLLSKLEEKKCLEEDETKFVRMFWSKLKQINCQALSDKLLPFCINTSMLLKSIAYDLLELILSVVLNNFLRKPINNSYAILASSSILIGLQYIVFEKSSHVWADVCSICVEIVKSCTETKSQLAFPASVSYFAVKCVCLFIDQAMVESEEMIQDLKTIIQSISDNKTFNPGHGEQKFLPPVQGTRPEFYIPMFEKIVKKIVSENIQLSDNDKKRLSTTISELNDFISSKCPS